MSSFPALKKRINNGEQTGLAALNEPLPTGAFYDWEQMVKALEKQTPFWKPGSMHGYHGSTFGWLVGEVES